jgi:hypothetical protein
MLKTSALPSDKPEGDKTPGTIIAEHSENPQLDKDEDSENLLSLT